MATPHGSDPVEEFDTGGHCNQCGVEHEKISEYGTRGVHVVCPYHDGQGGDRCCGENQALVAEQRFAAEHREDFRYDAEEWQCHDVDLRMAEEPEQVLPQDGAPVGRIEHVCPEQPVG